MIVDADSLSRLVTDIFKRAGCSPGEAATVARHLVDADLTGHPSHGVVRVPGYVDALARGDVRAGQTVEVVTESDSLAVVDGKFGFGQTVGGQATELGIAKAKVAGAVVIGLRHAGHLGRISDWAELAAEAGLVSIHFVNAGRSCLVAPFGSKQRRFGTNPIAIGIPQPDGEAPLLIDFATSLVAEGKARVALNGGASLPGGALIGPDGTLTADPAVLYGPTPTGGQPNSSAGPGALRAMGEHKGSALSLACELLAGILIGSGTAEAEGPFRNGMLSVYLSPDHFAAPSFVAEARAFADHVRAAEPIDPSSPTVLPGDLERQRRVRQLTDGVEVADRTWDQLVRTATQVGAEVAVRFTSA